jgi:light-regulated signal transduction histidine kinase (bacteriophytochrome)
LLEGDKPAPFIEQKLVRLDGTPIDVESAAARLVFEGKPAAQILAHNISERKRAEQEIHRLNLDLEKRVAERTTELESAIKELEAFSYSVSHDLRAPLRHIEGFIELLVSTKASALDEEAGRLLETISSATQRMGKLIDHLLTFSRTGRTELKKIRFPLGELVQSVIRDLSHESQGRQMDWTVDTLPEVEADPTLLRQVVFNLLSNSAKYTRPRKTAKIHIGNQQAKTEHVVFVRDNGVGFDPRYAHKLFGVFQRLHRTTDFEGTGIGLANVRRIVARHGGRTWAEGQPDKGATFYFSLPK